MRGLRELQRQFADYLTVGDIAPVLEQVADARVMAAQCLNIHRNNVTITLREALAAIYPVVQQLVGEAFFADVARGYTLAHPCRSGNLHDFGEALPAVLAADERLAHLAYLPDVAALEWAYHATFHGPDATALDLSELRQWCPEQFPTLYFEVHPGARLLSSAYPVLTIWEAHQCAILPDHIDLNAGAQHVLVLRSDLDVVLHRLTQGDVPFLSALIGGVTLEAATDAAIGEDDTFDLQSRLLDFVAIGAVVGVHA